MGEGRRERESPKQAPHCQHSPWRRAQSRKPWDHDLSWNQESYASLTEPPRAPWTAISFSKNLLRICVSTGKQLLKICMVPWHTLTLELLVKYPVFRDPLFGKLGSLYMEKGCPPVLPYGNFPVHSPLDGPMWAVAELSICKNCPCSEEGCKRIRNMHSI